MRSIAGRPSAEGGVMAFAQQKTIIEDLEERVEYWRQRAEDAEAELRHIRTRVLSAILGSDDHPAVWNQAVKPLSIGDTRVLRLLAAQPCTREQIAAALGKSLNTVSVHIYRIRDKLPEHMHPSSLKFHNDTYTLPDISVVRKFLGETDTPDIRRVA